MPATKLHTHRVEKPWGRTHLFPGFPDPALGGPPVGEVWFQEPGDATPELLIKYLFTSERLSVQVHPDDEQARAHGHRRGKDEAWLVLAADPGATIGLGTIRPMTKAEFRQSAVDGTADQFLDWKPVEAGDFIYSPARTVHAIGPGLTVIEVQQNVDLTYRFFDYGRPRELHLDLAVEVADTKPFEPLPTPPNDPDPDREILAEGPKFVVERRRARCWQLALGQRTAWIVPIAGSGTVDDVDWQAGECFVASGDITVMGGAETDMLVAYAGDRRL